jgi:hypothetical protein
MVSTGRAGAACTTAVSNRANTSLTQFPCSSFQFQYSATADSRVQTRIHLIELMEHE